MEDYEFSLRIARDYKIGFVSDIVLKAHYTPGSISGNVSSFFTAKCMLVGMYKADLLRYKLFDDVVSEILDKAKSNNVIEPVVKMLENQLK